MSSLTLLLLLAFIIFFPLIKTGYTTSDDVDLAVQSIKELWLYSKKEGRLNYAWAIPYTIFGEGLGNSTVSWLPRFLQALIFVFSLFFFGKRFLGARSALLGCLLFLVSWTNDWQHNAITSYSTVFIFSFSLFLFSLERYWDFLETQKPLSFFIHLITYAICLTSENFLVFSALFFVLNFLNLYFKPRNWTTFFLPSRNAHLIISVIFLILYLGFLAQKNHRHSLSLDWLRFLPTFVSFTFFGFSEFFPRELLHSPVKLASLKEATIAQVLGFGLLLSLLYKIFLLEPDSNPDRSRKSRETVSHLTWFFCLALLINLPVSLTQFYQAWVVDYKTTQYVWSVPAHSILCLVAGWVLYRFYVRFFSHNFILRRSFVSLLSLLTIYGFLLNSLINKRVFFEQKVSHWRWVVIDHIFGSHLRGGGFEDNAVLISPDLFSCKWIVCIRTEDYWSKYVKLRFSKSVTIVPDLSKIESLPRLERPVYELSLYSGENSVLNQIAGASVKKLLSLPNPVP